MKCHLALTYDGKAVILPSGPKTSASKLDAQDQHKPGGDIKTRQDNRLKLPKTDLNHRSGTQNGSPRHPTTSPRGAPHPALDSLAVPDRGRWEREWKRLAETHHAAVAIDFNAGTDGESTWLTSFFRVKSVSTNLVFVLHFLLLTQVESVRYVNGHLQPIG